MDEDEDDDYVDYGAYEDVKDACLFVIQVSPSMLSKDSTGTCPAREALQCAQEMLLYKIIANPKDCVGILLYGTKNSSNDEGQDNIFVLMPLDCPDAKGVRALRDLLDDEDQFDQILRPSKGEEAVPLGNVLFSANKLFSTLKPYYNSRRIFLVTDDDDPHASNKDAARTAITRAKDLNDLGVKIEPLFITTADKPFDITKFYESLIYQDDEVLGEDGVDGKEDSAWQSPFHHSEMMDRIKSKQSPRRTVFSAQLEVGPGVNIGIDGYLLKKREEIRKATWITIVNDEIVAAEPESRYSCDYTSAEVLVEDTKKSIKFGKDHVLFSMEETDALRYIDDPIVRLIGFHSEDSLKVWENMRPAYFLYPSEAKVTGSIRTFAALHKQMLDESLIALAWFVPRIKANPWLVALVAQEEILDSNKRRQLQPPGINVITLPFADDVRQKPNIIKEKAPKSLKRKMTEICSDLRVDPYNPQILNPYNPELWPNPSLQWHYRILQAKALDEETPDKEEAVQQDKTLANCDWIRQMSREKIQEFNEECS